MEIVNKSGRIVRKVGGWKKEKWIGGKREVDR